MDIVIASRYIIPSLSRTYIHGHKLPSKWAREECFITKELIIMPNSSSPQSRLRLLIMSKA